MIPPFTASIRWRSTTREQWEIDTAHEGFPSAEDAVMWANGLVPAGAAALHLCGADVWIELNNGQELEVRPEQITVWNCGDAGAVVGEPDFERVARSVPALLSEGLEGHFMARSFKVEGADGPLAIKIEAEPEQERLLISIGPSAPEGDESDDLFDRVSRA